MPSPASSRRYHSSSFNLAMFALGRIGVRLGFCPHALDEYPKRAAEKRQQKSKEFESHSDSMLNTDANKLEQGRGRICPALLICATRKQNTS